MSLGQFKERREVIISVKESRGKLYTALGLGFVSGIALTLLVLFFPAKAKVEVKIERQVLTQGDLVTLREGESVLFIERRGERTYEIESTGQREVSEKARGVVRIYNNSSQRQALVKNTRLLSKEGLLFRTTKYVVIPPKGYVEVEVVADKPGPEYNIPPTTFSVPGLKGTPQYTFVYARSFSAMKGGRLSQIKVVSQQDLDTAPDKALEMVKKEELEILQKEFGQYFRVLSDAIFIESTEQEIGARAGEEKERFNITISYTLRAVLVSPEILQEKALTLLHLSVPEGTVLKEDTLEVVTKVEEVDWDQKLVRVLIKGSALLWPALTPKELTSLTVDSAIRTISDKPLVKEVKISLYPFWAQNLPSDPSQIEVRIDIE